MNEPPITKTFPLTVKEICLLLLILLVTGLLFYPNITDLHLQNEDERRDVQIITEMDDWVHAFTPRLEGEPYPDKPPLYFWAALLTSKITGQIDGFSARFPSLLFGLLLLALLHLCAFKTAGRKTAIFTSIVFATSLFFHESRMARMNMMMTFWVTGAVIFLYAAHVHRKLHWSLLAGLFMGLGMLTKGPFAYVMPVVTITTYLVYMKDFRSIRHLRPTLVTLITLAIYLSWYLPAIRMGAAENMTVSPFDHEQSLFYYTHRIFRTTAPWSLFLIPAFCLIWNKRNEENTRHIVLWALWFLSSFIVVSLYPPKRLTYLLFLAPPFALFTGWYLKTLLEEQEDSPHIRWFDRLTYFLALGAIVFVPLSPIAIKMRYPVLAPLFTPAAMTIILSMLCILLCLFLKKRLWVIALLGVATSMMWFLCNTFADPLMHGLVPR